MQLSKNTIKDIKPQPGLTIPNEKIFELPEKVLQFGTGVLLRGLPDYFIDKANRQGIFNGRIVVVKSTSQGETDGFSRQDGLYTVSIRGLENGNSCDEQIINSSISRVLSATNNWQTILECAQNPEMSIIISNTTEVGITLVEDDIRLNPPLSFPGKLLAFLQERFRAFNGSVESGMVIIPTELIPGNADKLRSIVLELAKMNKLDPTFTEWIKTANHFCNSLVDRIVPGKLPEKEQLTIENKLGYKDELMIMAECFRLWAIESDIKRVKQLLSFASVDEGVMIAPDIEKFRELKLRLLNGTHTFSCGLAVLAGFRTVSDAMNSDYFSSFVHHLATQEISSAISGDKISYEEAISFARSVIDRFRNPFIEHPWLNICVQYSSKMRLRNIPLLLAHYKKNDQAPEYMSLGFAAYLLFMKSNQNGSGQFEGIINGNNYTLQDDHAGVLSAKWQEADPDRVVDLVLSDVGLWGTDLSQLNGFVDAVKSQLHTLISSGARSAIEQAVMNKSEA